MLVIRPTPLPRYVLAAARMNSISSMAERERRVQLAHAHWYSRCLALALQCRWSDFIHANLYARESSTQEYRLRPPGGAPRALL